MGLEDQPLSRRRFLKLRQANRHQLTFRWETLDASLPEDHRARMLWDATDELDLDAFYERYRSTVDTAGRPATDPQILLVLWLYATSIGVGSAREIARRCESDDAFRWICGGVEMNAHTLSDFRAQQGKAMDKLMASTLGLLLAEGLVDLDIVAQDGVRVRANAGADTFRRNPTLQAAKEMVERQIRILKKANAGHREQGTQTRKDAAALRAAKDRKSRLQRALKKLPEMAKVRERNAPKDKKEEAAAEARVSPTDPDARVMKMGDGGFRPAYNIQFASEAKNGFIVGCLVSTVGVDGGQVRPMLHELRGKHRLGRGWKPKHYLADGGFSSKDSVEAVAALGGALVSPVGKRGRAGEGDGLPKAGDSVAVADWRRRMAGEEAKVLYAKRCSLAERPNAACRKDQGLWQLPVRGLKKVRAVTLLQVVTYNLMRRASVQRRQAG